MRSSESERDELIGFLFVEVWFAEAKWGDFRSLVEVYLGVCFFELYG